MVALHLRLGIQHDAQKTSSLGGSLRSDRALASIYRDLASRPRPGGGPDAAAPPPCPPHEPVIYMWRNITASSSSNSSSSGGGGGGSGPAPPTCTTMTCGMRTCPPGCSNDGTCYCTGGGAQCDKHWNQCAGKRCKNNNQCEAGKGLTCQQHICRAATDPAKGEGRLPRTKNAPSHRKHTLVLAYLPVCVL